VRQFSVIALALLSTATPVFADCRDDLIGVFARQSEHGPYHVESVTVLNGAEERVSMDIVPRTGISVVGVQKGVAISVIVLGDRGWIQSDVGWEALDASTAQVFVSMLADTPVQGSALTNVACVPDGFTFEVRFGAKMIPGSVETEPASGRIMRLTTSVGDDPTTLVYTYDPAIQIAAPTDFGHMTQCHTRNSHEKRHTYQCIRTVLARLTPSGALTMLRATSRAPFKTWPGDVTG
jgi:hypothetical protein